MFSIYVYGCFAFMYVCVMYVHYLLRSEEGIGSSETGITDGCELSCGWLQVLVTTEPSVQPLSHLSGFQFVVVFICFLICYSR